MKRTLFKLVLFLLIGAIVNIAVAWALVFSREPRLMDGFEEVARKNIDGEIFRDWDICRRRMSGSEYVCSDWNGPEGGTIFGGGPSRGQPEEFVPPWAPDLVPTDLTSQENCSGIAIARSDGWPLLSVRGLVAKTMVAKGVDQPADVQLLVKTAFVAGPVDFESILVGDEYFLPYGWLWPGFAINTIFYAGIVWLMMLGAGTLRRWRRRNRGLCPTCGYDLRGSANGVCPECGTR